MRPALLHAHLCDHLLPATAGDPAWLGRSNATRADIPVRRPRPAWRGITGWVLMLTALVMGVTAPYPYTGVSVAAMLLAMAGGLLVAWQIGDGS